MREGAVDEVCDLVKIGVIWGVLDGVFNELMDDCFLVGVRELFSNDFF